MNHKPLIGLTPSFYEHKEMDRSILGKSYTDSIQSAGGLPVLIPPIIEESDLADLVQRLDGVVLTGGDDLDPTLYGEDSAPLTPKSVHPRRVHHDEQVFRYVWEHKVPTLAICLGMQEVNVFLGGSLYQDIPTQLPEALVHRIGDWFDARHEIHLLAGSRLSKITGQSSLETNSAHHQAIKRVADDLRITARSRDGMIEALEPLNSNIPLLAVQWHPESEINDLVGIDLFKWLIQKAS